jgi:uncharacterized membrane protein
LVTLSAMALVLPSVPSESAPGTRRRLDAIDVVRGFVMIVMALDHTRDFFGIPGQNPGDLSRATAALFLTRWITHICAPVFCLLMGTGAFFAGQRRSPGGLVRFLLARGAWLIVLDVVILRCAAYQFNVDFRVTMLLVLWMLGWSLIALAPLTLLPARWIAIAGIVMIAGHNLFDGVRSPNPLWVILHRQFFVLNTPNHVVFVGYPLIPWIGVAAVGYSLGQVYLWSAERRRRLLLRMGVATTVGFVVIRAMNRYGDPSAWAHQQSALFTVLSFLNTTKYPPSLLFLLMTLGPALLFLRAVDDRTPRLLRPARVIGKVPLAYYAVHFALIHALATAVCYLRYGAVHWMFESPDLAHYPFSPPPGWGFSLPVVYAVWALVVCAMYPFCRWFAAIKDRGGRPWLSYL